MIASRRDEQESDQSIDWNGWKDEDAAAQASGSGTSVVGKKCVHNEPDDTGAASLFEASVQCFGEDKDDSSQLR